MVMAGSRSMTFAGAVAVAVLCVSLVDDPARAQSANSYAFGNTQSQSDYATLTLQEGSQSVSPSTNGFQGWISPSCCNDAGFPYNTSYLAGVYGGSSRNNFFVFNIAGVNSPVTSATLNLYAGAISGELDYSLYAATSLISQLANGNAISPNATLYAELGSGVKYGSFVIGSGNSLQNLVFTLNAAAVQDINAAIAGKKTEVAIAGSAAVIPEPSTWIMMLAGFAGLGLATARRAAARSRVAAAAR
jgi:PEP-CTERM motif